MISDPKPAEAIFDRALDFEPSERGAYLAGACGNDVNLRRRVEDLLIAHETKSGFLPAGTSLHSGGPNGDIADPETISMGSPITETPGTLIDRYKLLEKLGEGGFGAVWAAEQREPVKRRVALKIIKLGMDTRQVVARFEAERQALALMDHPNIAKVLDAGTTETGRPYFVMELVRGIRITKYCDQEKLSTHQRLDLFMKVCHAIQHAHQKGIIHRDIKPSNILVTLHDGVPVPKVIDFGIAKATQQELTEKTIYTQFQQFIGTPAYMSPEQAEMSGLDIDTRSDIYSLGVLLYELLTGVTPFDSKELMRSGLDEMRKIIREREPLRPSSRLTQEVQTTQSTGAKDATIRIPHSTIDRDLDWIVMKCLEKDRSRRYETANGLRLDVERFLTNEPVTAVAPSLFYKLRKFGRRNRLTVGAAAAVGAALVIGLAAALGFYAKERAAREEAVTARQEANRQRNEAETRRKEAEQAELAESKQRHRAEENARRAEEARLKEQKQRYAADMVVVQNSAREQNAKLGMDALLSHIPASGRIDLRGWEWRYLYGQLSQAKRRAIIFRDADEIAIAPNGLTLAVAGDSQTKPGIRILSYPDLNVLRTLPRPGGWVAGMWFSPDSEHLILEQRNGIHQYDLATGDFKQLFDSPLDDPWDPWPLKITPDRRWVVGMFRAGNGGKELRSFQAESGEEKAVSQSFRVPNPPMIDHELRISPDGSLVSVACADGMLRLLSVPELEEVREIQAPGEVAVVAWSPDGELLATGCDYPYRYDLWNATTGDHRGRLPEEFAGPALDLSFSPDGSRVAGCDVQGIITVWTTDTLERIHSFPESSDRSRSLAFHPDNLTLASAGAGGAALLWDTSVRTASDLERISKKQKYWQFQYSPDGRTLAVRDPEGVVGLFDPDTEELLDVLPATEGRGRTGVFPWASQLAFSSDGRMLVAGNGDRTATVYSINSRKPRYVLDGHSRPIIDVRLSPDERLIGTTAEDDTLILWDAKTGDKLKQIEGVRHVDFHPDSSDLVVATGEHQVALVNIDTEERLAVSQPGQVWSVTFAPDGNTLAVGMLGEVGLYRYPDLELITTITGPRGPVPMVAFHPDGDTLAIPAWAGTLHLWSAKVSGIVGRMPIPRDWAVAAQFSPDGNTLAVSTRVDGIQLFRAPTMDLVEERRREEQVNLERLLEIDRELDAADRRSRELRFSKDPGSVSQWLLLGPLPRPRDGLAWTHFPDEGALEPRAGERVVLHDQAFVWNARRQREPVFKFSSIYATDARGAERDVEDKTVLAVSFVVCDRPLDDVVFKIGSDDEAVLYLNGEEIYRNQMARAYRLDQDEVSGIKLHQGVNRLVFRVDNGQGRWAGSVRFTDGNGRQIEGVRITADLSKDRLP